MDEFLRDLLPLLQQIILLAAATGITIASAYAKRKWGVDIEARHRAAIDSAIASAVSELILRLGPEPALGPSGVQSPTVRREIFGKAFQSVPDGFRYLIPTITEVVAATSPLPDAIDRKIIKIAQDRVAAVLAARR